MNEIQTYSFEGLKVRVVERDGAPWFIAQDACSCLDVKNVSQALKPLDADEKGICSAYSLGTEQDLLTVSEGGLYTLILRSRAATTPGTLQHRFRKWVTSEVLPSIRKHGSYQGDGVTVSDLDAATRRAIGGMIKSNAGVVVREALAPIQAELADTRHELEELRERLESPLTCSAADLWAEEEYPPLKGGTVWFGNRLIELGCLPEYGSRTKLGGRWRRLFDAGRARIAIRNGLGLLTERYIAERQGQGKLKI